MTDIFALSERKCMPLILLSWTLNNMPLNNERTCKNCKDLLPERPKFLKGIACLPQKQWATPKIVYCKSCMKFDKQIIRNRCMSNMTTAHSCRGCCRNPSDDKRSSSCKLTCFTHSVVAEPYGKQHSVLGSSLASVLVLQSIQMLQYKHFIRKTAKFCEWIPHSVW